MLRRVSRPLRSHRPRAPTVYSDRYFKYGLRLCARRAGGAESARGEHGVPLCVPRVAPPPGAGVLHVATHRRAPAPPRLAPMRRVRTDLPRVFSHHARQHERGDGQPVRCVRTPMYRQGAATNADEPRRHRRSASPRRGSGSSRARSRSPRARSASVRSRLSSLVSRRSAERVPQFAQETGAGAGVVVAEAEAVLYERVYERAYGELCKSSARESDANMAATREVDKLYEKAPHAHALARKVLNTERYNNGARVWLAAGGEGEGEGVRAGVRALLGAGGLLYSAALLAFYFLSLP